VTLSRRPLPGDFLLRVSGAGDSSTPLPGPKGAADIMRELDPSRIRDPALPERTELWTDVGSEDQDRLWSLASQIGFAEERLRESLAADLHHGLGQDMALIKLGLSGLRRSSSPGMQETIVPIERLVEQADRALHLITFQLSPHLEEQGLVPALSWLAEDMRVRYGLDVKIEDEGMTAVVDDSTRLILFRAVRELLKNAAVHARAREVLVRLGSEAGRLWITVEDDVPGFDAPQAELEGCGLYVIREHLGYLGGLMHIDSVPGRGTRVTLAVPVANRGRTAS
jgi:signal transduction histidine kinase